MFDYRANNKEKLLSQLNELFFEKLAADDAQAVAAFAEQYYLVAPVEELAERRLETLYGATLAAWQSLQVHDVAAPKLRVFNPDFEQHGWHCNHTVIEILHPDMPFLVDSIRMELNRRELSIHHIHNAVLCVRYDQSGRLAALEPIGADAADAEQVSVIYLEVDRHSDPEQLKNVSQGLLDVLTEVRAAVHDFRPMQAQVRDLQARLEQQPAAVSAEEWQEGRELLAWLLEDHFTFLGYEACLISDQGAELQPETRLGIARNGAVSVIHTEVEEGALLRFARSELRARVHRPTYQDIVLFFERDPSGRVTREHRFYGLYTSPVYSDRPNRIPVVRRKVASVLNLAGFDSRGHNGKEILEILHQLPREELFLASSAELHHLTMGIFNLQERRKVKLIVRQDSAGVFVSCHYFVPRDVYSTALRERVQQLLCEAFGAADSEFSTGFSESILSRTHFLLRLDGHGERQIDLAAIEAQVIEASRCWDDELHGALVEACGEEQGNAFATLYRGSFSSAYREHFAPGNAVYDVEKLARLDRGASLAMSFYRVIEEQSDRLRFKLFTAGESLVLSDVIPVLENLGMRVVGEHPYEVRRRDGRRYWMHDFMLSSSAQDTVELQDVKEVFQDAFANVWQGCAENDEFNRLVIGANLSWREVTVLRAYARYNRQIGFAFSQPYIADALVRHRQISRLLVALFKARFEPGRQASDKVQALAERIEQSILDGLDKVDNLNDDQILRRYLELIKATLRTNYYQQDEQGEAKAYLSFKIEPERIAEMPLPRPRFEIFVYSPRVEGVHLRGGKVARGGLRWSDRTEDYRTEVLGLVKAQQVKNAVIVPVGAKGGFVAKQLPDEGSREEIQAEGIACYQTFIRGLLDLSDNLVEGEVVPPAGVVRHDEDDPYLVVAADKGTATFSDIANEIAEAYGFWLGDAFASGGSQGYDHKKMGITARGAWESVKRHFRERGLDTQKDTFTAVAIGDMAGDVFGNGMLLSEQIRLVGAFNHLHIFIDPDPDPALGFAERKRLFELPRSSWADYNRELISRGGGVFSRQAKSIELSPEIRSCLQITQSRVTPNELVSALLKAPVDLLWNGGIGTYVKASQESHADVGDKANDALRINGNQLRCRVVGEGGNLGLTQLGRIEYARAGGACYTDFIDNAGGVDCSDHEVNIKILLNELVARGDLTLKHRNQMLREMTEEVAELVLRNNYAQTQALSVAEKHAKVDIDEYIRLIHALEAAGKLDRELEFLPDDETLAERKARGAGLTRPELSVLISYTKAELKQSLIDSPVTEDPYLVREIETAFPTTLVNRYRSAVYSHRLRREIIATQLANGLVNRMGITFVQRLKQATGATDAEVVSAYVVARDVFDIGKHWGQIEALDYQVEADVQAGMMADLIRLVRRAAQWFLRSRRSGMDVQASIAAFKPGVDELVSLAADMLNQGAQETWQEAWQERIQQLTAAQVPERLSALIAGAESLYGVLGIIQVAERTGDPLPRVAKLYLELGEELQLGWFDRQIRGIPVETHWQSMARDGFRDDLNVQQQLLTVSTLAKGGESALADWLADNRHPVKRWKSLLGELRASGSADFAVVAVAVRELLALAQTTAAEG